MTKYRIVRSIDGQLVKIEVADIFAWAAASGLRMSHMNSNHRQRAELQGQPVFSSLCGPMWDGDAVRYEDQEANDRLSM